jgi:hypothetical protein
MAGLLFAAVGFVGFDKVSQVASPPDLKDQSGSG